MLLWDHSRGRQVIDDQAIGWCLKEKERWCSGKADGRRGQGAHQSRLQDPCAVCRESVSSEAIRLPSEFREATEDIGDSVSDWLCILEGFQGRCMGLGSVGSWSDWGIYRALWGWVLVRDWVGILVCLWWLVNKYPGSERGCGHLLISGCGCFLGRCRGEIEGHRERGGLWRASHQEK